MGTGRIGRCLIRAFLVATAGEKRGGFHDGTPGASEPAFFPRRLRVAFADGLLQFCEPDVSELLGDIVEPRTQVLQMVVPHDDQSAPGAVGLSRALSS